MTQHDTLLIAPWPWIGTTYLRSYFLLLMAVAVSAYGAKESNAMPIIYMRLHLGPVPWRRQSPERRAALPPRRPQDEAAPPPGRQRAPSDPLRRVLRLQLPEVARALPALGGGRPARGRAPARVRVRHLRQVREGF